MYRYLVDKVVNNKSSLLLFIGNSLVTGLNFIILAFLSHVLPKAVFGSFRYVLSVNSIGIALGSVGFASAVYYYLSATSGRQEKYDHINSARALAFTSALLSSVAVFFFMNGVVSGNDYFGYHTYSIYLVLLIFLGVFQSIELNILINTDRIRHYLVVTVSSMLIRLAGIYLVATGSADLDKVFQLIIVTSLTQCLYNQWLISHVYRDCLFNVKRSLMRSQFKYGLPLGLGVFFGILMLNADRMVLSYFFKDPESFAIVSNGNFEIPFITTFYVSFSTIALPRMIAAYQEGDMNEFFTIRHSYVRKITWVLFPAVTAFIIWGTPLISLLFGEKYRESGLLFSVYAITFFIRFASHHDVFLALGRTRFITWIQGIELVVHVVLCLLFIPLWGIIGASVACVVTNALYFACTSFLSAQVANVPVRRVFPWTYLGYVLLISFILAVPFFIIGNYIDLFRYGWLLIMSAYLLTAYSYLMYQARKNLKNGF